MQGCSRRAQRPQCAWRTDNTFWMQLCAERPHEAPSTTERSIKSLLTAWSTALHRSPSILFQDLIHSSPDNPSSPSLWSAVCPPAKPQPSLPLQTPAPVLSATPSCRGLFEKGRDIPHIVLNREKCRVQLHLQNQHLTTAMLMDFILGDFSDMPPLICGIFLVTVTPVELLREDKCKSPGLLTCRLSLTGAGR
ncbi:hypothetical protein Q5P01_014227 [Channa striata]|uniref:Uncharacterized protein n=1 Tax=Channa striata TaxID=64152 RepID=A0AA88MNU3_CHASR|nr:hypothetical protein Q5P01_014227 [Channa striata]